VEKILLVGDDLSLLAARAASLASNGAKVVPTNPSELATHLGNEQFDRVVLTFALAAKVRRSTTAQAHRRWPNAQIVQDLTRTGEAPANQPLESAPAPVSR
jgi:hypothetical protein